MSSHLTIQKCGDCKAQHLVCSLPPGPVLFIVTPSNPTAHTMVITKLIKLHHGAPAFLGRCICQIQRADVHDQCGAGILSLLSSISHRFCLAQCWILPELQRQMSSPHRGYGMRTRGAVVGAEGVAAVGMEVVEADAALLLMLRIAC